MAVSPSPSVTLTTKPENPESENSLLQPPDPSLPPPTTTSTPSPSPSLLVEKPPNPNPSPVSAPAPAPTSTPTPPPPSLPSFPSFTPAAIPPPTAPSFRPITSFAPTTPLFTPIPNPNFQNPNYQNPNIQPPGVNSAPMMLPGSATVPAPGAVSVSVSPLRPGMYQMPPPGQPPNLYQQMPNGYSTVPQPGSIPPPGIPRYPTTYTPMVRPPFPPRPPGPIGMPMVRPPVPGIRGVPPVAAAIVRPVVPIHAPTEKPQTTVYVGKIASTVENDFILSLLRLCGPVKSWKRAQDPSNGTPRGFGFCEFESAEGVLRALRLLSKFSVDGQELVLNVNQATREYLERYVEKKTEREKLKEIEAEGTKKEEESAPGVEKNEPPKPSVEGSKDENALVKKETEDSSQNFGIVTDEDREADRDALEKLQNMLEERLKTKPLPPPPTQPPPDVLHSNSEAPTKSRDGDSDVDIMKNGDDKNDEEMTSENKPSSEHDRPETSSPDRSRKYDRSRERDKERDIKRDKERELERYERERERERVRRERDREMKIREAERMYRERLKEWESREREKAHQRQQDRDREKERERERRREIMEQEDESDDDDRRKRRRSSVLEEKRKKRKREKEEDMADRLREEEEIAEAKKREIEEQHQQQQQKNEDAKHVSGQLNGSENSGLQDATAECRSNGVEQSYESDSGIGNHSDDVIMKNGVEDDSTMVPATASDTRQSSNAPTRKLGFGLVSSGKRTAVPSVFHEEDEDDEDKDKKMRPLVPIDYSTEELQAVQTPKSGTPPPNLAAAAEFAKRISNVNPKDERSEAERDRSRRPSERSSQRDRDRDRNDDDRHRSRDDHKEKTTDRDREREHAPDKLKAQENKKLLDAKQLIDMIPKTKEELFSYAINWMVYDKHELHERMRPWISKKITEFLGEPEPTLVDYIVSKTKDHVQASEMLELLQAILDDEAEMFVLKMWRMLIFEIKKVETGLAVKPKA